MNADGDGPDLGALIRAHGTRHRAQGELRAAILRAAHAEAEAEAEAQAQAQAQAHAEAQAEAQAATRRRAAPPAREDAAASPARSPVPHPPPPQRPRPPQRWTWAGFGALAGSLATAAAVWLVVLPLQREAALQDELVGHHVRALMPGHLADVASTDRHTVKPWFQGKLDYAPPVEDPSPDTPLVGGRLDVVGGRPVAVLVYRQRAHVIDAFVWPTSKASALRSQQLRGFSVVSWSDGAMQHWLVSDLNGPALAAFAEQLRNAPR